MKILIVDDHRIVRDGLRTMLEAAGFSVVGSAANGHEAIERARELAPDVVIMDITMPELDGIEATRLLTCELPRIRVLALSMKVDRYSVLAMFGAGAQGYLSKAATSTEELVQAIRAVAVGNKYVSPAIASVVLQNTLEASSTTAPRAGVSSTPSEPRPLSLREREVLQLLAEGKASKEIARALTLALPTVETHRRQIMAKLGIHSIAELTKYAVREGLTPLD